MCGAEARPEYAKGAAALGSAHVALLGPVGRYSARRWLHSRSQGSMILLRAFVLLPAFWG